MVLFDGATATSDFQLRLWMDDPTNGIVAVKIDVLLAVWKQIQERGIDIPFPQRVLYHKSLPELKIGKISPPTRPAET